VIRVLKPGGSFAGYDWCLTDKYNNENREHVETKRLIEEGDGLPELKSTHQLISDLKSVGFTIEESKIIPEGDIPWYQPLKGGDSFFSLNNLRATSVGRWLTRNMVWLMEKTWIAAQGSVGTLDILEKAAKGLVRGGESEIFTPYFFFSCSKILIIKKKKTIHQLDKNILININYCSLHLIQLEKKKK
jgi:sterol 24-C-methyltransferase